MNEEFDNDPIEPLTPAALKFIIARMLDNANDACIEAKVKSHEKDRDFYIGRRFAYYEMLDTC